MRKQNAIRWGVALLFLMAGCQPFGSYESTGFVDQRHQQWVQRQQIKSDVEWAIATDRMMHAGASARADGKD
jgi:hypothetical protein